MQQPTELNDDPIGAISLKSLAEILIKHNGLHDGLYDVAIEFKLATGGVGPSKDEVLPGVLIGVSAIGLNKAAELGPNTVDAAAVNPRRKSRPKKVEA